MRHLLAALLTAARRLHRLGRFALGAASVLALGIAAATALFALVRGVLLRPLPYAEPQQLVVLVEDGNGPGSVDWPTSVGRLGDFSASGVFAGGLAATRGADAVLIGSGAAERLTGVRATGNLFQVLGVQAQLGRLLAARDARPEAPPVAVISDGLWRRRFAADPAIVGRTLSLEGDPRTIVGVAPPTLQWPRGDVDLWIPFIASERETVRAWFGLRTVGRLAPGVELPAAHRRLTDVARRLDVQYADSESGFRPRLVPILDHVVGTARRGLRLLQAAVGLVLLIAVANLANLLVARGARRQGELALRAALGAGRWAALRLLLREGLVIGALGAALGLPLGALALRVAVAAAGSALPRAADVHLDLVVIGVGLLTALLAAAVAALLGGLGAGGRAPAAVLRSAAKGSAAGGRRRVLAALVVVEVAAATALAAGGGLLLRSLAKVTAIDPGVDPRGVVTLEVAQPTGAELIETAAYYRRLLEAGGRSPALTAVSAVSRLPVVGSTASTGYELEGRPNAPGESPWAPLRYVEPGALPLLRVPLLAGRDVAADDGAGAPRVLLVNRAFARLHYGSDAGAVGKRLWLGNERGEWRTVVGVVGDVHLAELEQPMEPTIWAPFAQATFPGALRNVAVIARSPLPPPQALAALRGAITAADPLQAPTKEKALDEALAAALAPRRFQTGLFAAFAVVAALLAAVGIYAVTTYSVLARRDELAVRLALGSRTTALLGLVLGGALRLALLGAVIGAGLAVAAQGVIAASLVELEPWDPATLAAAAGAALLASTLASLVPAVRAARTSALRTLRGEG